MSEAAENVIKKHYVYQMAKAKKRISPRTKARMKKEYEDAILAYASEILNRRDSEESHD